MVRYGEGLPPTGRGRLAQVIGVLGPLLILGCASNRRVPDAAVEETDTGGSESDAPVGVAPNLDALIGLGGGSFCEVANQCLSGACTLGKCSDWAHAMQLAIDTTASGANVGEDIAEFPLLVRLDAANFTFGEASPDGSDIRFLDSSGNNLSIEIERWDPVAAAADIWVLVPRIVGNSRDNVLLMHWGNRLAGTASSGPAVFMSFSCAFHMDEDLNEGATQIDDASGQGNTGAVQGASGSDFRNRGITGSGLALGGSTMLVTTRRLPAPQSMALSLWFKTTSTTRGGIANFAATPSGNDVLHDRALAMDSSGRVSFSVLHGGTLATVTSLASYNDDQWHFIVARFSSAGQYLFVDGESVADDPTMTSGDAYSGFWRFGEEPMLVPSSDGTDAAVSISSYVSGSIDEVRATAVETSDAWIKLAYATQRPGATAIVYGDRQ